MLYHLRVPGSEGWADGLLGPLPQGRAVARQVRGSHAGTPAQPPPPRPAPSTAGLVSPLHRATWDVSVAFRHVLTCLCPPPF